MNIGRGYRLSEFLVWTRREIYVLIALSAVPVCLYEWAQWRWLAVSWPVVALIGTATAFIVSFKNTQTYGRTFEGGANDVPIAQINRMIEIELREMLGDKDLPRLLRPHNNIIL